MFKNIIKLIKDENAVTTLQYALFVSLLSITLINSVKELGGTITDRFSGTPH